MWRWIDGPGSQLKYPRQNSTNYLGAYDREGNLVRVKFARADENKDENQEPNSGEGATTEPSDVDRITSAKNDAIPETLEDLRPFPLNPYFRSEAVLSEELRREIYRRVVEQGKTIREVSIDLSVEMSRVGAVVRLMTIEQDWIRKVSTDPCTTRCSIDPRHIMMRKIQNIRLVLKTTTWLQHLRFTFLIFANYIPHDSIHARKSQC